jgi:membrane associated rhomboid family serine protease
MTPWVRRLLIANVIVFLVLQPGTLLYMLFTLYPPAVIGMDRFYLPGMPLRPWGLVTYMFLHAGIGHLFFNMIGLFFFGPRLESRLGPRGFLGLYFLSGLGGAAFSFLFSFDAPVVGASAAVYGILIGFAMYWPREHIYIYGILPIQAWVLAVLVVLISLYSGIAGTGGVTAHFAHLGGLAVGGGYLKWRDWHTGKDKRDFQRQMQHTPSMEGSDREARARWSSIELSAIHELNRSEVEGLLTRVDAEGAKSLSTEERAFLDRMSSG